MQKAAAVLQAPGSVNNMPELLMAWFYAGFHAGTLCHSSGCGADVSSSGHGAASENAISS